LIVSREDGVQLLKKWLDDDIPISLRILAPGFSASLAGFVSKIDNVSFIVTHLTDGGEMTGQVTVKLSDVTNWNYRDVREASDAAKEFLAGRVAGALQFDLEGGIGFCLYELVELTQ